MPRLSEDTRATRRSQVLDAALTCFARTGYHVTTMADVATEAGVSKGTPYLYFSSKEALYRALYEEWDCGLARRLQSAVGALTEAEAGSPRRVLEAVVMAVGAHVVEHAQTCRVLMESRTLAAYQPAIAAAVQASDTASHEKLVRLIRDGIAAGEWPPDTDPALEARLIGAALHGLMAQWHLAPGSFSWEAAATSLATGRP